MATKKQDSVAIVIPKINLKNIGIKIEGVTPLIIHKWSEKAKKEMLDKQTGNKTTAKEHKSPIRDFIEATYYLSNEPKEFTEEGFAEAIRSGATFGFPSIGFKQAAVSAAYRNKISKDKVSLLAAFFIEGEFVKIEGIPTMREDMVVINGGSADLRYRPEFTNWTATLNITYNADIITPVELVNMINLGGFSVGVGEWRVEKGGQFGMFKVVTEG